MPSQGVPPESNGRRFRRKPASSVKGHKHAGDNSKHYQAIYRISEAAYSAGDLHSLLALVHGVISELFPAKNFYIALYNQEKATIQFPYFVDEKETDLPQPDAKFSLVELDKSLTAYVIKTGQSVLLSPARYKKLFELGEVVSKGAPCVDWLGVPLKTAGGKTIGMMAVQTYVEGQHYGVVEKELLSFASTQIAMMIERQRVTDALRESEERLNLAIEAAQFGLWDYYISTGELIVNEKFAEILGYHFSEINNRLRAQIIHPDDLARLEALIQKHVHEKTSHFEFVYRARAKDGSWRWIQDFGRVGQLDEHGKPVRITGTNQDITRRMQVEVNLRRRDAILEAVSFAAEKFLKSGHWEKNIYEVLQRLGISTEADRVYIFQVSRESDGEFFSQRYEWVAGAVQPQIDNENLQNVSTDHPGFSRWKDLLSQNKIIMGKVHDFPEAERLVLEPQGIISIMIVPIFADQDWWGFIGFDVCQLAKDLSSTEAEVLRVAADILGAAIQNQRTEDSLRESEARQRIILDTLPDLIFLFDSSGVYLDCYSHDNTQLYLPRQELLGRSMSEVLPPEAAEQGLNYIRLALETRKLQTYEYHLYLGDKERYFEARMAWCGEGTVLAIIRDISEQKETEEELRRLNEKLTQWINELELRNREVSLLNKMSDMLQSCLTAQEAFDVIQQYAQLLFRDTTGGFYFLNDARNILEQAASWGSPAAAMSVFPIDLCWGLRRGRIHIVNDPSRDLNCQHLVESKGKKRREPYMCVPMIAQGDILGLLFLSGPQGSDITRWETMAVSTSEQVALSISNLKLRQQLQIQSVRDVLTNLYNRRYMQETLERELSRARRYQLPLSVAMADIDHFKQYNDTFGHEAGDIALQEIGALMTASIRKEDIACRYGGDELAIILPGATLEDSWQRVDNFRQAVKRLKFRQLEDNTPLITVSFGIAGFPDHAGSVKELLNEADKALYAAKRQGRDNVQIASPRRPSD